MNQPKLFSSGLESAHLVASTGLLNRSWKVISDLYADVNSNKKLCCKVDQQSDLTIIAFVTPTNTQHHLQSDLVPSLDLMDNPFEFMCTKSNPSFSLNRTVVSLFNENRLELDELKSQIDFTKPLIVTGHALGGSIASLFTLWQLDSIDSGKKYPLCITFGSPLIGNQNLQQAISRSSTWNSCFLHVASHQDPVPSSFTSTNLYKPFGTFLLCSDHGSACFENPESILILLKEMRSMSGPNQGLQTDYGNIVENLNRKAVCKGSIAPAANMTHSNALKASLTLQLWALGIAQKQVTEMEKQEMLFILRSRKRFDPSKKLNEMKTYMAQLEWYKKVSKTQKRGYYDSYKNDRFQSDQDVVMFIKILNNYWKDMVKEAEMKPQKEGAAFRTRWLYAGTNYRRMVEPLDISQYYKDGGKDYVNQGRPEHYKQLQKWLEEEKKSSDGLKTTSKENVESILTLDSCFWAYVEEALISCRQLKSAESSEADKKEARERLIKFEDDVFGMLKNYAVSPEIFLEDSSYMRWWDEYKAIMKSSNNSTLANFMKNPDNRKQYEKGVFDFH